MPDTTITLDAPFDALRPVPDEFDAWVPEVAATFIARARVVKGATRAASVLIGVRGAGVHVGLQAVEQPL
jgi:hypothetical protein